MANHPPPKLPQLLERKIYKTGQTRGADDDVIYQNRVGRSSTVLIPFACWEMCAVPQDGTDRYQNGFIVLLTPEAYFGTANIDAILEERGLGLGVNALVFYETRSQWEQNSPGTRRWRPARRRTNPLGGQYVARIPATTATTAGERIVRGYNDTAMKGAGIRVYEYASDPTNSSCRRQLEAIFWLCRDAQDVVVANGMSQENAVARSQLTLAGCQADGLLDLDRLRISRILNAQGFAICPLCLEELTSAGFLNRLPQAAGRVVPDLTVTELNLFHIDELRYGALNHRPYNLGWGHHHCNVVVRDSGIAGTLEWMRDVLDRNDREGHLPAANRGN